MHLWAIFSCPLGCVFLQIWFSTCLHIMFLFSFSLCYISLIACSFSTCSCLHGKLCSGCDFPRYMVGGLPHIHLNWNLLAPFSALHLSSVCGHPSLCSLRVHQVGARAAVMNTSTQGPNAFQIMAGGLPTLFCCGSRGFLLALTTFL